MRLICANCAAQYEIAAAAIPEQGREVKCSACGHVWFQVPAPAFGDAAPLPRRPVDPEALGILREEAAREARARAESLAGRPAADPVPEGEPAAEEPAGEPVSEAEPIAERPPAEPVPDAAPIARQPGAAIPEAPAAEDAAGGPEPAPPQIAVDPVIADVLPLGPAGDGAPAPAPAVAPGGLPDDADSAAAPPNPAPGADAAAPLSPSPRAEAVPLTVAPVASPGQAAARRPALPDPRLAESTLTPARPPRRGRFATGFVLGLVVVAALAGLYVVAPGLAEDAPAAAPYLGAYVTAIDAGRLWLDATAAPVLARLRP